MVCNIGTAVALYRVGKRHNESVAIGYVASRIVESTRIVVGIVSVLSVVTLRRELAGSADAATLAVAGHTLVAVHDWTFLLGPSFCAGIGNCVLLGYLMLRSGLVPRPLAAVGLVGGPLAIVAAADVLFGVYAQNSHPQLLLTLPEIVWEASFGLYLVVRGFATPTAVRSRGQETGVPAVA